MFKLKPINSNFLFLISLFLVSVICLSPISSRAEFRDCDHLGVYCPNNGDC
jgi:hypothetical protein